MMNLSLHRTVHDRFPFSNDLLSDPHSEQQIGDLVFHQILHDMEGGTRISILNTLAAQCIFRLVSRAAHFHY